MASTTFTDYSTVVRASWLNDVNTSTYGGMINVKTQPYSAVGNGVADDTAAFAAALLALSVVGGTLFVPPGTYRITSTLPLYQNVSIVGVGRQSSVLSYSGTGYCFSKTFATHSYDNDMNAEYRNFGVVGSLASTGAFYLENANFVDFINLFIHDFNNAAGVGITLTEVYWWTVARTRFENIKLRGLNLVKGTVSGSNMGTVGPNCEFNGNNQVLFVGLYAQAVQELTIMTSDFEGSTNGLTGVKLDGCEGVNIFGNYIELWTGHAIDMSTGDLNRRVTITQNLLNSTAPAINLNNTVNTNDNIAVFQNRFPDIGAGQDLIVPGNTTNFIEYLNDPDGSDITPTYTTSNQVVTSATGSFTGTLTGCTTSPTGSIIWIKTGNIVTLTIPSITGTSNSTSCTVTGIPTRLQPSAARTVTGSYQDNGISAIGLFQISNTGVLTIFNAAGNSAFFTGSGTKGINSLTVSYAI